MHVSPESNESRQMFVHRDDQIKEIENLLGDKQHMSLPCTFIYGQKATGKTSLVTHLLETQEVPHVMMNCAECYAASIVYGNILKGIDFALALEDEGETSKCDNSNDFVRHLKRKMATCKETFYIVFDKAEYLRDLDKLLFPLLMNLQSITGCNISLFLITDLPWEKFYKEIAVNPPYTIFFPNYSTNELMDILVAKRPEGEDPKFYRNFVHILVTIFCQLCRDLMELHFQATQYYPAYCKPVMEGKIRPEDNQRLWKAIEPKLKQALNKIYFRHKETKPEEGNQLLVELPFYTKFLLIAAYIASFNPPSSDKRFFMKNAGRMRKKVRHQAVVKQGSGGKIGSCHLIGPHSFPLNRLMAIFYHIADSGRIRPTINLFSQVSNLVSLQLLARMTRPDEIDSPKYKCLISIDNIVAISKTVGFEITEYLYDFI